MGNYPQPVTLANLLTHNGGFSDYYWGTTNPGGIPPLEEYPTKHMPPRVMPSGESVSCSRYGYDLAAHIVEFL